MIDLASLPHRHSQSSVPVDFMADEVQNGLAMVLNDDERQRPTRWLVPMNAGETIIFTSHNWHRSSPNGQRQTSRDAYIQTWVHPKARWRPDLVPWHPVNEHMIRAGHNPGDDLCGDRHPTIWHHDQDDPRDGEAYLSSVFARHDRDVPIAATKEADSDISMFDASDVTSTQIRNILSLSTHKGAVSHDHLRQSLVDILSSASNRQWLVDVTMEVLFSDESVELLALDGDMEDLKNESSCDTIPDLLAWILKSLLISAAAYACHRSRNVFNSAYSAWWMLAGKAWNAHFLDGKFEPAYRLCRADVDRFLALIRVRKSDFDSLPATGRLDFLTAIVGGCMEYVPFQNVTMLTRLQKDGSRRAPTLGQVINDMLTGTGGLCTCRNPFLFLLLNALDFQNVRFVSVTLCPPNGRVLKNAHVACLVCVNGHDYWVDIANGFPYMKPLRLDSDGAEEIHHPFVHTRLIQRTQPGYGDVFVIQHKFQSCVGNAESKEWVDNGFFRSEPVSYEQGFAMMRQQHYDSKADFGPFLKNFRFNMWSGTSGVLIRNMDVFTAFPHVEIERPRLPQALWEASGTSRELANWIRRAGFEVNDDLISLVPEAWAQSQSNAGKIRLAEEITVTGGFFDKTADAFVGLISVWRCNEDDDVVGLTYRTIRVYTPDFKPVINKGFAGGSWYNDELHIDNPQFNDLHHVHACRDGLWVANTGLDSVDHLSHDGQLIARCGVVPDVSPQDCLVDIRDQAAHTERRGRDQGHVNHNGADEPSVNMVTQLPKSSPPHEGFFGTVPSFNTGQLMWNSTVDGLVIASDSTSGEMIRAFDVSEYPELPRGWTRGLCVLPDGLLVGSSAIRGSAEQWIQRHDAEWNFDVEQSRTAVSFIPFDQSRQPRAVDVLNERRAKVFSLLLKPQEAKH
eukprot:m.215023 g.215023  ORF g.215023 m.215023 type:complete len:906 (-) comp15541_c0_seq2:214-2931(-)